jgi:cytochrome c-type biogenesis protein CcmF
VWSLASVGRPSVVAALGFAGLAVALFAVGAVKERRDLTMAGRRAVYATAAFTGLATLSLVTALFAHDFSLAYVASYSSRSLSGRYTITALWGGMEGSLLFWTLLLTCFSTIALTTAPARTAQLVAWAGAVLASISVFFLLLLAFPANPFVRVAEVPSDGQGLNPLLQSPGMLFHPPLLYTGFVGFSIPCAFAVAALLSGHLDDAWFTATRRWTLFAYAALSVGIVLGGAWAYTELGWGGYWAWDPVENASFMPWLTATAFVHSVVIQEKRQMLKVWNVCLILVTYVLAVFGTFLTRSGILSSIHTFTESGTGKWFLPFLAVVMIGGLALVAYRLDGLRSENRFDSLLSRESAFLFNNVLFLAAAFTVLWGTIYPILNEALTGVRISVGPPFFDTVFIPIALAIVGLAGVGPLISWRRMSKRPFLRMLRMPLAAGVATIALLGLAGVRSVGALLAFGLCSFTAVSIGSEFLRGSRIYRSREVGLVAALARTLLRNRRRYGGYVVHLGVVLIVIGLAGAAFRTERASLLHKGGSMRVGAYTLRYTRFQQRTTPEKQIDEATIAVYRGGRAVTTLYPQRNFHFVQSQPQSEVAIRTTPAEDLYVVVTAFTKDHAAALRAFVNPLTWWIWIGAAVLACGMTVILSGPTPVAVESPARPRVREPAVATR